MSVQLVKGAVFIPQLLVVSTMDGMPRTAPRTNYLAPCVNEDNMDLALSRSAGVQETVHMVRVLVPSSVTAFTIL